jgi:hypothetical protein
MVLSGSAPGRIGASVRVVDVVHVHHGCEKLKRADDGVVARRLVVADLQSRQAEAGVSVGIVAWARHSFVMIGRS